MWIIAILVIIPVIEIALFIELGGLLGLWPTIGLVIGTAILGGMLLRAQGVAALSDIQGRMAAGADPSGPIAHGLMILIAGLLMLTPGFFTDSVGFAFLLPPVRRAVIAYIGPRLAARATIVTSGASARREGPDDAPIDADYVDLDASDTPPRSNGPKSRWTDPPK